MQFRCGLALYVMPAKAPGRAVANRKDKLRRPGSDSIKEAKVKHIEL